MSRVIPGRWNADGSRPSLVGCTGSCAQGHESCDCELQAWIPRDDKRVITPPQPQQPTSNRACDLFIAVVALALLAFGIWVYPH